MTHWGSFGNTMNNPWQAHCVCLGRCIALLGLVLLLGCTARGELSAKQSRDAALYNAKLGANHLQRGDLDLARNKLEKALQQDPRNAFAHVTYAQLQYRVKNIPGAREHFDKAIALEPDEARHRNSYGIFLCQQDEFAAAEGQFKKASENPYYETPEYALDNAGLCMLDADRLANAEAYLRQALRINPKFANSYLHMSALMYKRQRLTVADAYFQRYLAYGHDTAESLLLGLQIKRDAGDIAAAEQYAGRLLDEFPASREAGEYLSRPIQ